MWLELSGITKHFGTCKAVDGLSLSLEQGAIACLLGPSGCGKTTVLRCVAGFETVDKGEIHTHGRVLSQPGLLLPPHQRRIGMVFQDYALFPHLTVTANVAFGLHAMNSVQRGQRAAEMLEAVGLLHLGDRYPHQLSGGQQQRVALARSLAPRPELLLLDEPFSSLDVELRQHLSIEVRNLLKQLNTTALMVTHDQDEAFVVADLIGVMREGRLEQWDSPYDLYHKPTTRFVADFVGQGVFVKGIVVDSNAIETGIGLIKANGQRHWPNGSRVDLLLRPDDVIHDDASELRAEIRQRAFRGAEFLYTLRMPDGTQLLSLVPSHHDHHIGEHIGIRIEPDHMVAFDAT
jgi:iron(III) transport system ATP-binding protein